MSQLKYENQQMIKDQKLEQKILNTEYSTAHYDSQMNLTSNQHNEIQNPSWDDFEVIHILGHGSYGTIYKVRKKCKFEQHLKLNHQSIISESKKIYVVKEVDTSNMSKKQSFESLEEINIMGIGKHLNENKIWKFFIQITLGMHHLHSQNILHRDLKTLNIFLTKDNQIRIGDLGVAKILQSAENFVKSKVGTPYYLSPEVCEDRPYNNKSDIWSLGCVLYEMCCLKHPFEAKNQAELLIKIIKGKYESLPKKYSKELGDLVHSCLMKDYNKRPSIEDIILNQIEIQPKPQIPKLDNLSATQSQLNFSRNQNIQNTSYILNSSSHKESQTYNQQNQHPVSLKKQRPQKTERCENKKLMINQYQSSNTKYRKPDSPDSKQIFDNEPLSNRHRSKLLLNTNSSPQKILKTNNAGNGSNNVSKDQSFSDAESQQKLNKVSSQKRLTTAPKPVIINQSHYKYHINLKDGDVIPEEGVTQHQLRKQYDKLSIRQIQQLQKLQVNKKNKTTLIQNFFKFNKPQIRVFPKKEEQEKQKLKTPIQQKDLNQQRRSSYQKDQSDSNLKRRNSNTDDDYQQKGGMLAMKRINRSQQNLLKATNSSGHSNLSSNQNNELKTKKTSEDTRKMIFEKFKNRQAIENQQPLNAKLTQIKNRIQNAKNLSLSKKLNEQNTIKECTHSSKSSNKFQMSGKLKKNRGEQEYENFKIEDEDDDNIEDYLDNDDELGDLLDDEELDMLLLGDFGGNKLGTLGLLEDQHVQKPQKLRLSYLEDDKMMLQNSLFEIDFEKDIDQEEYHDDPFIFSRQQIIEDVLKESSKNKEDHSSKRHRVLKSQDAGFSSYQDQQKIKQDQESTDKSQNDKDIKKLTDETTMSHQISVGNDNKQYSQSMRVDASPKIASTTHQNLREFFLGQDDNNNLLANQRISDTQSDSNSNNKQLQQSIDRMIQSIDNKSGDLSFEQHSIRNINFSMDGELLKDRIKEIDTRILLNQQKCLELCQENNLIFQQTTQVVNDSLKKEEIFVNDFQDIQNRIQSIVVEQLGIKEDEEKKQWIVNELLFSLFKIYYLLEEKSQCLIRQIGQ
ncbi:protein kinase domain containing protein [Stylonychia lemnae]|uniref:non-specific serine/threonine protein kinase n=1 Tax=Stylonychia lemnae TaxID=5949 RepID=A0A078A661_STYLE|nr:protein kinase domain containing protein [Stylonychia lemnae]|eukprot:CDW77740.1 protein kinase domain containing protein [Stylonychia lemnae]